MGHQSMKERVSLLRGEITIQTRSMQGTKILIKIPFPEKAND
jgi:signal transduction histidine kinase